MNKLRLLKTGHGDLCLAEWDVASAPSVSYARQTFAREFTPGRLAFRLDGPGRSIPITEFDEEATEIILVPAIQGG